MRLKARAADLAAENRRLVPQNEDLELLGSVAATEEHDELEQAPDNDVQGTHRQRRPPADGGYRRYSRLSNLALRLIEYLHPTAFASHNNELITAAPDLHEPKS